MRNAHEILSRMRAFSLDPVRTKAYFRKSFSWSSSRAFDYFRVISRGDWWILCLLRDSKCHMCSVVSSMPHLICPPLAIERPRTNRSAATGAVLLMAHSISFSRSVSKGTLILTCVCPFVMLAIVFTIIVRCSLSIMCISFLKLSIQR